MAGMLPWSALPPAPTAPPPQRSPAEDPASQPAGRPVSANGAAQTRSTSSGATTASPSTVYQVHLNVYDVSRTPSANTNTAILRLNNVTREIGLGGVFHGAIQISGEFEWSFGYCEVGTGVYCCRARQNPAYTFRESIELGSTDLRREDVKLLLARLKSDWPGASYELLNHNCCHFCEEMCRELGVKQLPGWLNRFATGAEAMVTFTNDASALARQVGTNITRTAATASTWFRDSWTKLVDQASGADSGTEDDPGSETSSRSGRDGGPHAVLPRGGLPISHFVRGSAGNVGEHIGGTVSPAAARRHSEGGAVGTGRPAVVSGGPAAGAVNAVKAAVRRPAIPRAPNGRSAERQEEADEDDRAEADGDFSEGGLLAAECRLSDEPRSGSPFAKKGVNFGRGGGADEPRLSPLSASADL